MPTTSPAFQSLPEEDQRDALGVAAGLSGRPAYLLEKDIWVVQVLRVLFQTEYTGDLTFKGGTSLSKVYRAIRRFSEDIDVTYNILAIDSDLELGDGLDPIPTSRNQADRWKENILGLLDDWVRDEMAPAILAGLERSRLPAKLSVEGSGVSVAYPPLYAGNEFVQPRVLIDFGARSTGEPRDVHTVRCDAAEYIPGVSFPTARPHVMVAERTFWEKATAVHAFCRMRSGRGERLSRHWYDLVRLDDAGYADSALKDRDLGVAVARHKFRLFRERDNEGGPVDYEAAVRGALELIPEGEFYQTLSDDYGRMAEAGMLLDDDEDFEVIMGRCLELQDRANSTAGG